MRTRLHFLSFAALILATATCSYAAHAAETQKSQTAIGGDESHEALRARIISPIEDKAGELICQVEILEGRRSGETLEARCPRKYAEVLHPGDVCLVRCVRGDAEILDPCRDRILLILIGLLVLCLAVTMGARGLRVLASVLIAVVLVVLVFLPLALRGWPPLLLAAATGMPLCVGGITLIGGWNRKSLYAIAGSLCALGAAIWLPAVVCRALAFTGLDVGFGLFCHLDVPLWYSPGLAKVNFYQLMLAGMVIASLGAIMDAAMGVSTAVWEVKQATPAADRAHLRKSGFAVDRDIMGAMIIAIVLIYAGCQFEMLLLFHTRGLPYHPALLLDHEEIAVEVVHMISTSFALALSIPFTTLIAAHFLGRRYESKTA
ncbi:MAG: YibE/F family protein [Planctomycetes bacterium]|nr:YibE/F family protein [Planctomycetota bacterium]